MVYLLCGMNRAHMMFLRLILIIAIFSLVSSTTNDEFLNKEKKKILVIPTIIEKINPSHAKNQYEIAFALAEGGYDVTVLSDVEPTGDLTDRPSIRRIPRNVPIHNFVQLNSVQDLVKTLIEAGGKSMLTMLMNDNMDFIPKCLEVMLENQELMDELRAEKFDLAITEYFFGPDGTLIADALDIPFACTSVSAEAMGEPSMFHLALNIPFPLSYTPISMMMNTTRQELTFIERVFNTLSYIATTTFINIIMEKPYQDIKLKYNIKPHENMVQFKQRMEMAFVNSFLGFSSPSALPPNFHYIGGITALPDVKPLPDDVEEFLRGGEEEGVIYLAFGLILPKFMDQYYTDKLFESLSQLKYRVIAPWSGLDPQHLGENVKIWKWIPQNDVLADSRIKVVINHCGLGSVMESIYHKKPQICFPFWGDSMLSGQQCDRLGICKLISLYYHTPQTLAEAVDEVISDIRYRKNTEKVANMMSDRPLNGRETLNFWVGHWFRNNGSEFTKITAPNNLYWFQYFLLDVILLYAMCICLVWYLIYRVFHFIICKLSVRHEDADTNVDSDKDKSE